MDLRDSRLIFQALAPSVEAGLIAKLSRGFTRLGPLYLRVSPGDI
jgi:hypothetical protein